MKNKLLNLSLIPLLLLGCDDSAKEGTTDFFIKFANLSTEKALADIDKNVSFEAYYCEVEPILDRLQMDEAECKQRLLTYQKKCKAELSSKKILTSEKALKKLAGDYIDCVTAFKND